MELTLFWTAKSPARRSISILMRYPGATIWLGEIGHPDDAGVWRTADDVAHEDDHIR